MPKDEQGAQNVVLLTWFNQKNATMPLFLTIKDVAYALGVSSRTAQRMLAVARYRKYGKVSPKTFCEVHNLDFVDFVIKMTNPKMPKGDMISQKMPTILK